MELPDKKLKLINAGKIVCEEELLRISDDETAVKVDAIGVCSSDCRNYAHFDTGYFGHELVGRIITPHEAFQRDDRVVVMHRYGCRQCPACRSGSYNLCMRPVKVDVGFRKFVKIRKHEAQYCLYKIPRGVCISEAVFADSAACAVHALKITDIKPTEKVIILGCGFMAVIFSLMIQIHNRNISVYVRNPKKKAVCKSLGVESLEPGQTDEIYGYFDVCIDTAGDADLLKHISKSMKCGSRCLCFSGVDDSNVFYSSYRDREVRILFSKHHNPDDVRQALCMLKDGCLPFRHFIKSSYSLDAVEPVIKAMLQGSILRGVIEMDSV